MSEPDSLYARLSFDPGRYRGFLDSVPAQPATFADWHAWLAGRETYGRPSSESAFSGPLAYPPIVDA